MKKKWNIPKEPLFFGPVNVFFCFMQTLSRLLINQYEKGSQHPQFRVLKSQSEINDVFQFKAGKFNDEGQYLWFNRASLGNCLMLIISYFEFQKVNLDKRDF